MVSAEGTDQYALGNVSQWGEVKKKTKDRARVKTKDSGPDASDTVAASRPARGRGPDAPRGRARAADKVRGAGRVRGGAAAVNGSKKTAAEAVLDQAPTGEESVSWAGMADGGAEKQGSVSPDAGSWEVVTPSEAAPPLQDQQKPSSKPDGTRSWASMLKPAPKPKVTPVKPKAAPATAVEPPSSKKEPLPAVGDPEIGRPPTEQSPVEVQEDAPVIPQTEPAADLTPTKDELTETNLEQVQDVSNPVASETVASIAGTNEIRSLAGSTTPSQAPLQPAAPRPGRGGFATTAHKATSGSARGSSLQRRVKDQQEAVVMPGHHAVDRTAVQFGSLGLGGQEDVDGEREEAETRTQPPQHSPVAPRASLPPVAQQAAPEPVSAGPRPAPGLPSVPSHGSLTDSAPASQAPGTNYGYNQFNSLYGGGVSQGEAPAIQPKPFDPFAQQSAPGPGQAFENYPPQSQAPAQHNVQQGAFSTAASDYPSYYASDSQRGAYQNYYGSYGQQTQPGPQDHIASQQKAGSGFSSSNGETQPGAPAPSQPAGQTRFPASAEAQPSGQSTPNPALSNQASQGPQSHQPGQGQGQAGAHAGYPYGGNPYYNHPYYSSSYMNQMNHHQFGPDRPPFDDARRYDEYLSHNNQYGYGNRPSGYGTGPYTGGSKYGQPHSGYGMSSHSQFDAHSASPANVGAYGQPQTAPGRENSSGLGGYGRVGSAQPSEGQSHGSSAFGGMSEVFNRTQSGFSTQTSQQQPGQHGAGEESSRGFGDNSKIAGGPSPAPGQSGARPGSAANLPGQSNAPSSQAQVYGGYPSQMGQMHGQQSQYAGGLGGLGGHHQGGAHQSSGYGYGGFGGNYYGNSSRGGWSGSYGH